MLAQNERFARQSSFAVADVDVERLRFKRRQSRTFAEDAPQALRIVRFEQEAFADDRLLRAVSPLPFVPSGAERDARTEEILMIQSTALLTAWNRCIRKKPCSASAADWIPRSPCWPPPTRSAARAIPWKGWSASPMPGMGTGSRTLQNALKLMQLIGCTTKTIPIGKAVAQHFDDIGQDPEKHDIAY